MAQQTKAAARTLPREPSLPRQSEPSWQFSAFICFHHKQKVFPQHKKIFSFSVFAQSLVHPEPERHRPTLGERHTQPLSICGYYHPGAHLRLPEA